jgi:hypothetical protein
MKNPIILVSGLLILSTILPKVDAVVCDSFKTKEVCERTMTSSGGCRWRESGTCVNDPTRILPAGMVAIANVPELLEEAPTSEVRQ